VNNESDDYIRDSLNEIIMYLRPDKFSNRLWLRKKKARTQSEEIVEEANTLKDEA
jgi:hypothetical protein